MKPWKGPVRVGRVENPPADGWPWAIVAQKKHPGDLAEHVLALCWDEQIARVIAARLNSEWR